MKFKTINDLMGAGFVGFVSVAKLWGGAAKAIPFEKGVYMVVRPVKERPKFLEVGTGGYFKGKNPNVTISELEANWVEDTCVIYIGKANFLCKRIGQYLRFGRGKSIGHWGGRLIWQLNDADELLFCWKELQEDDDPNAVETSLIEEFKSQYMNCRPFANLAK